MMIICMQFHKHFRTYWGGPFLRKKKDWLLFQHYRQLKNNFTALIVFFWVKEIQQSLALQDSLRRPRPADPFWIRWTFDLFASRRDFRPESKPEFPFLGTEGEPGASFPRLCLASVTTQGATHPPNSSLLRLCNPACLMHHRIRTVKAVKANASALSLLSVWESSESIKCMILWNLSNIFLL